MNSPQRFRQPQVGGDEEADTWRMTDVGLKRAKPAWVKWFNFNFQASLLDCYSSVHSRQIEVQSNWLRLRSPQYFTHFCTLANSMIEGPLNWAARVSL
jgi:hypothetical protein